MTGPTSYRCNQVFDGDKLHQNSSLLVQDGVFSGICPQGQEPEGHEIIDLGKGVLSPGFIDLQVNGGGGLMLGDAESVQDMVRICAAHIQLGTTALTPTLITDTPENTRKVVELGIKAWSEKVPGFAGLHLEGPHLFQGRKGAHDADLIRPMSEADIGLYIDAAGALPNLMITVAPETVTPDQIERLSGAGIRVSLGHSGATYAQCKAACDAGACCVTHLFNAMSQLQHREPGLVGAALDLGGLNAGLIADGVHVDPVALKVALNAKQGPGRIFLVSDAMSQTGTDVTTFELGGRRIYRKDGTLRLEDGTLAGADIDLPASLKYLTDVIGLNLATALAMATSYPADVIKKPMGRIETGLVADFVFLSEDLSVDGVWLAGAKHGS